MKLIAFVLALALLLVCGAYKNGLLTDVVHCFSDPENDAAYAHLPQCPKAAYRNGGRCYDAYVDHWKDAVQDDLKRNATHNFKLSEETTRLRLEHRDPMMNRVPRWTAVCVDFDLDCSCSWLTVNKETCARVLDGAVLTVGDSMTNNQMWMFERMCGFKLGSQNKFKSLVQWFNPRNHIPRMEQRLKTDPSVRMVYIGIGTHMVGSEQVEMLKGWDIYEERLVMIVEAVRKLRPDVEIVFVCGNAVVSSHFTYGYRMAAVRNMYSGGHKDENITYSEWKDSIARGFTRRAVKGLATRAVRVFTEKYPAIDIIDGYGITAFMEQMTIDGIHYFPFIPLKLSILLTRHEKAIMAPRDPANNEPPVMVFFTNDTQQLP